MKNFWWVKCNVVELPVKKCGWEDVNEAKKTKVENFRSYGVLKEVADEEQETIGTRRVVTAKETHDGQKNRIKARLVSNKFQETNAPQA